MTLNAEQILQADDIPSEVVEVPEWGGSVRVRGLTATEKDQYDRAIVQVDNKGNTSLGRLDNLRALLVVRCLVDDDGDRLFKDSQAAALGQKSSAVVGKVWRVAARLSGMSSETAEEEAEVFAEAQDDDSSSA